MLVRWRGHHPRASPPAKVRVLINDSDPRLCRALFSFVTPSLSAENYMDVGRQSNTKQDRNRNKWTTSANQTWGRGEGRPTFQGKPQTKKIFSFSN
jgi:hypothetical protein